MPRGTVIDQAYERYEVLSRLIDLERDRARANPQHERYLDLGITELGDTKQEASRKIVETFDGLAKLIEHVAIVDMAGSFELFFRARIGNAIGFVRRLVKENPGRRQYTAKLVKDVDDFEGLKDILGLVGGIFSKEVLEAMDLVRKSRNTFAHGTDVNVPPIIEPSQARDNLNEIAGRL